eukprot:scaffold93818_cov62-Phaeocystis_antarctica.AAC.1
MAALHEVAAQLGSRLLEVLGWGCERHAERAAVRGGGDGRRGGPLIVDGPVACVSVAGRVRARVAECGCARGACRACGVDGWRVGGCTYVAAP